MPLNIFFEQCVILFICILCITFVLCSSCLPYASIENPYRYFVQICFIFCAFPLCTATNKNYEIIKINLCINAELNENVIYTVLYSCSSIKAIMSSDVIFIHSIQRGHRSFLAVFLDNCAVVNVSPLS